VRNTRRGQRHNNAISSKLLCARDFLVSVFVSDTLGETGSIRQRPGAVRETRNDEFSVFPIDLPDDEYFRIEKPTVLLLYNQVKIFK